MIKVLIADDHPMVCQGIKQILEDDPFKRFGTIDIVESGGAVFQALSERDYNLLLLDISLPGRSGLDILPDIKRLKPMLPVMMVSIFPEDQYAITAVRAGASGYLMKSSAPDELLTAAVKVSGGGRYLSKALSENLVNNILEEKVMTPQQLLSERELQVIRHFAEGKTIAGIARELSLSPKTISTYRERVMSKLKLRSTSDIIRYALKEGLAGDFE